MNQTARKTILLVEDQAIVALAEKSTLTGFGYDVITVGSGKEAVDTATSRENIDLILMDIDLGSGMSGADAAEEILSVRELPIVFLTSHSEREFVERVKRISRYGYVIKNSGEFVLRDSIEVAFELFAAHRRYAEKNRELEAANEELERFFTVNLDLLCIVDSNGAFVKVNKEWENVLGYRAEAMKGMTVFDFVHPDDLDETKGVMKRLENKQDVRDFVNRYRCRDGSYRFIEWRSHPSSRNIYAAARDITERREAEEALRLKEAQYRGLFERAPVGIFQTTSSGKALVANSTMARTLGFQTPVQAVSHYTDLGKQLYTDARRREEFLMALTKDGYVENFEFEARRIDGEKIWLSMNARVSEDHEDGSLTISGFTREITNRKRAQEERRQVAKEYETVFNATQDALFLIDVMADGTFQFIRNNNSHVAGTGITLEQLKGKTPHALLGDEVGERIQRNYQECVDARSPISYEETLDLPAGRKTWATILTPVFRNGQVAQIVGSGRDITGQKAARKELERERFRLAAILDGTNVGTWEWNVQTGETRFDQLWAQMIGYTLEELSPVSIKTWERFMHPDDLTRAEELLARHFRGEAEYYEFEARMWHKRGEWVWVLDRGKVASWTDDGKPLLMYGTHQDVTEKKRGEENRERELTERTRLMDELNHRVKNNLSMVSSLIALKDEDLGDGVDLSDIQSQVRTIGTLHDKFLHHGTISRVPVREYIGEILPDLFSFFTGGTVEVHQNLEKVDLPTRSALTLGLLVNEFATNAMKHGFKKDGSNEFHISFRHAGEDTYVLKVSNSGTPVPEQLQLESAQSLGFRLIGALVQQLEGHVEMARTPQTTFTVTFPVPAG